MPDFPKRACRVLELGRIDYGAAHITILNDSPPGLFTTIAQKDVPFLQSDLAAANQAGKRWKLVMHHRPLYSSANRGDTSGVGV